MQLKAADPHITHEPRIPADDGPQRTTRNAKARPNASLAALLTAAAALLPASQAAKAADSDNADTRASYRFSEYEEDSLNASAVIGDPKRYRVLSQELSLDTKLGGGAWGVKLDATHEVMSGSSPLFVEPDANGRPVQVLSGATIRDHRSALSASLTQNPGTSANTIYTASYSTERDYHATAAGIERSQPLDQTTTLGYGGSFSHDLIRPFDAAIYGRIARATKNTASAFGSLAWVLDRDSVLQAGVQLNLEHGFLTDPYKLFAYGDDVRHESRPERRVEAAGLLRYRHSYAQIDAALHLDYRYAQDSWGLTSHTVEASWYQGLGNGWRLVPSLRWYSQSAARFYAPFFAAPAGQRFYSSDYRLGTFGAFSTSINVRKAVGRWEFSVGAERYHAAKGLALGGGGAPVPALVDFTRAWAGLDYGFD